MPTIPYHHLYDIHILVIISRRVVDAFGPCFLSLSFMLAVAFHYPPPLLYEPFISFLGFRVGPSIAVSSSFFVLFTIYLALVWFRDFSMLQSLVPPTPESASTLILV
jgi:hypothetical protein